MMGVWGDRDRNFDGLGAEDHAAVWASGEKRERGAAQTYHGEMDESQRPSTLMFPELNAGCNFKLQG